MNSVLPETLQVEQYVVAYLDILGMRDSLRKLDFDPEATVVAQQPIIEALKETVYATEMFYKFFDAFDNAASDANANDEIGKAWHGRIRKQTFGDTLLLYYSLKPSQDHSPVGALYRLFAACCGLCVLQLGRRHPIRGAIEVGAGCCLPDGPLYSSAVVKCLDLEKKAEYPRIVVGPGLTRYMDWKSSSPDKTEQKVMSMIREFIYRDQPTGQQMIDFLGKRVKSIFSGALHPQILRDGFEFARTEQIRFENEKNTKLAPRYQQLNAYIEKRRYLWTDLILKSGL